MREDRPTDPGRSLRRDDPLPDRRRRRGRALPGEAGKSDTPAAAEMRNRIQRMQAIGDAETVLERIREFCDHGVTKFIAIPMAKTADDMIEQCRRLSEEVIPHAS